MTAFTIDKISYREQNIQKSKQSIEIYKKIFKFNKLNVNLFYLTGWNLIQKLQSLSKLNEAIRYNIFLLNKFQHSNINLLNQLGISYLSLNRFKLAKECFLSVLNKYDSTNIVSMCHYAVVVKLYEKNLTKSIDYFEKCLETLDKRVMDARFFLHLGDALQRLNRTDQAYVYYRIAADNKLFLSVNQRSIHNEPNLRSQALWQPHETNYQKYLQVIF